MVRPSISDIKPPNSRTGIPGEIPCVIATRNIRGQLFKLAKQNARQDWILTIFRFRTSQNDWND